MGTGKSHLGLDSDGLGRIIGGRHAEACPMQIGLVFMLQFIAEEPLVGLRFFSADSVLSPYIYVFYAAYLVAFVFTPILRAVAIHYGIIDQPDGVRKMHTVAVAYLGGLAVFLGWLTGLSMSQFLP